MRELLLLRLRRAGGEEGDGGAGDDDGGAGGDYGGAGGDEPHKEAQARPPACRMGRPALLTLLRRGPRMMATRGGCRVTMAALPGRPCFPQRRR